MSALEPTPGEWWLRDANQVPYAIVKLLRRGDEIGYRAVTYLERSVDRELVGYYRKLAPAAVAAHERHLRSMASPTRRTR